jgi:hypothetical protein
MTTKLALDGATSPRTGARVRGIPDHVTSDRTLLRFKTVANDA